jgi:magnesium transporter
MHARHEYGGVTWVDLESPGALEVRQVANEFGFAEHIAEELAIPSSRQRLEEYPGYTFVVMHFPAHKHSHAKRQQEINFVVGPHYLVTARYDTIDPLHKFSKVLEVNTTLQYQPREQHAGHIFFQAVRKLYNSVEHELESIKSELSLIEERIFSEREIAMVAELSRIARALLNLRQTIEPHREILRMLEGSGMRLYGEEFFPYLRALSNEYYRVHNHVIRTTDFLHELRETNNSLLTTKQNQTMKVFTIMAFTTFPLTLLVATFGMGAGGTPIIHSQNGFLIILGIMLAIAACMFLYFRHKKWL